MEDFNWIYLEPPILQDFPNPLRGHLDWAVQQHHSLASKNVRTRRSVEMVYQPWRDEWCAHFAGDTLLMAQISTWLSENCRCPSDWLEDVSYEDMIDLIMSVAVLLADDMSQEAMEDLCQFQIYLVNMLSRTSRSAFEETAEELQDLWEEDEEEIVGEDPERTPNSTEACAFTSTPLYEQHLARCVKWKTSLHDALASPTDGDFLSLSFREAQEILVRTIRDMKKVSAKIYKTQEFLWAVKSSGLASLVIQISHPAYEIHQRSPHIPRFLRLHAFAECLAGILDKWTPLVWREIAVKSFGDSTPPAIESGGSKSMVKGRELLQAMSENPELIPRSSNPSAVFFALSLANFLVAWHRWLGYYLRALDYQVAETSPEELYRDLWREIRKLRKKKDRKTGKTLYENFEMPGPLRTILDRTILHREEKEYYEKDIRQRLEHVRLPFPGQQPCSECVGRKEEERCRRQLIFTPNSKTEFRERVRGIGVTNVPKGERMSPRKGRCRKTPSTMHTTQELGLECIRANPDVIERCKVQVFYIYEYEGGPLVDFIAFGVFPRYAFENMAETIRLGSGVKPVRRGAGMDFWHSGSMFCFGARQPSGGRAADEYVHYAGIEADTIQGIDILFRKAQTSYYQLEAAKILHKKLFQDIVEGGEACERVGEAGVNLYTCDGYTAPIHSDDDACRSLCSQIRRHAKDQYSEFGFCSLENGYYIHTQENMLWSFDATKMHGTVLPSEDTLQSMSKVLRLRGGVSQGDHQSITKKNKSNAQRRQEIRHNYNLRERVWVG
ncbi:hypothetical protein VNI00_004795 [Paramarasmius palmivorus]|uniref:Uncharacterized protein n=1 Tax=Paramarasmius palmivorus TaxID=297713 RepID=A0AAW0DLK1_9AGAR